MSSYVLIHCYSGQPWLRTFNLARTAHQGEDRRRQWPRLSKSGGRLWTVNCQRLDLLRFLKWWQQILQDLHLLDGMVERYCHHGKRPLFLGNENLDILFMFNTSFVFNDASRWKSRLSLRRSPSVKLLQHQLWQHQGQQLSLLVTCPFLFL